MREFQLPADLTALDDPGKLAADVRSAEVRLDWSRVTVPNPVVLAQLLSDLDAEQHAAALGLSSASAAIAPIVTATLQIAALTRAHAATQVAPPEEIVETPEESEAATPKLAPPPAREVRDELVRLALADLRGPAGGEHEVLIKDRPDERYIVGSLAPKNAGESFETDVFDPDDPDQPVVIAEADEELDSFSAGSKTGDDSTIVDVSAASGRRLRPRSIGLTFAVDIAETTFQVRATWGQYRRVAAEDLGIELPEHARSSMVWERVPSDSGWIAIALDHPQSIEELYDQDGNGQVLIKVKSRRDDKQQRWLVTVFLVNERLEPKVNRAVSWLFQAALEIRGVDNRPILRSRLPRLSESMLAEESQLEMLYRKRCEFAVGHGTAVDALGSRLELETGLARGLVTVAAPQHEVPAVAIPHVQSGAGEQALTLDMRVLAMLTDAELSAALRPLATAYRRWIGKQAASIGVDPTLAAFGKTPDDSLDSCRVALARIEAGIELLETDAQAANAFRFMQEAMADQRVQSGLAKSRREGKQDPYGTFNTPQTHSWRPFQLAFILLNLPALTQLDHPDRSTDSDATADLLWFPTGGGKTEAYLGLTAYTLAIRRAQGEIGGRTGAYGVAVLMRYTLRLLTLQQFQRAAALMCACELIRARDPQTWGREPFRLGLWVGRASSPNKTSQAKEALEKNYSGYSSPVQLTHCPWCGSAIDVRKSVTVDSDRGRTLIFCNDPDRACPFSRLVRPDEGLPVVVVDEEVYKLLPSLVIATIDKFARVPWVGGTRNLFGGVDRLCTRHGFWAPDFDDRDSHFAKGRLPKATSSPAKPARPIDLIIQDELHLISGPLGSIAGLYETAVDGLLTWTVNGKQVRPKVVASTATIRRAVDQVMALFARRVEVFPPSGIDIADSFFGEEQEISEKPGRLYLGLCVPGMRHKAVMIRVYV
ncbi:MAG: DISARM system helicase DrmA, partial [Thermomicrobiales bacterium]